MEREREAWAGDAKQEEGNIEKQQMRHDLSENSSHVLWSNYSIY